MWSRTYYSHKSSASIFFTLGVLAFFSIFLAQKFNWSKTAPISTTAPEIANNYQKQITELEDFLAIPNSNLKEAEKKINDFFFSARVPDAARDPHLAAVIALHAVKNPTLSDYKKIITDLRTRISLKL